jgi:hypothetical protein
MIGVVTPELIEVVTPLVYPVEVRVKEDAGVVVNPVVFPLYSFHKFVHGMNQCAELALPL